MVDCLNGQVVGCRRYVLVFITIFQYDKGPGGNSHPVTELSFERPVILGRSLRIGMGIPISESAEGIPASISEISIST